METTFYINNPDNKLVDNKTTKILNNSDALSFHSSLKNYKPTPLIHLPYLAKKHGVGNIYLKDESFRFGLNSFKCLGSVYAISQILKDNPKIKAFCTATDGNHGRAVAWSAKLFNKESVVIVPKYTTDQRIKTIENEGAEVEKFNGNYDEACAYAEQISNNNGWQLVQDMAWNGYEEIPAKIMAGYTTLFKEIEKDLDSLPDSKADIVFLQAGVGSFAGSGIYHYLTRYGKNRPKTVIVEPTEADAVLSSFIKGKVTTSKGRCQTIMVGLNCGTPSIGAWNILKSGADVAVKINDEYARAAVRELYYPNGTDKRIVSGESGVAGLAGFFAIMKEEKFKILREKLNITKNTNILFISTEGATDINVFNEIINSAK